MNKIYFHNSYQPLVARSNLCYCKSRRTRRITQLKHRKNKNKPQFLNQCICKLTTEFMTRLSRLRRYICVTGMAMNKEQFFYIYERNGKSIFAVFLKHTASSIHVMCTHIRLFALTIWTFHLSSEIHPAYRQMSLSFQKKILNC